MTFVLSNKAIHIHHFIPILSACPTYNYPSSPYRCCNRIRMTVECIWFTTLPTYLPACVWAWLPTVIHAVGRRLLAHHASNTQTTRPSSTITNHHQPSPTITNHHHSTSPRNPRIPHFHVTHLQSASPSIFIALILLATALCTVTNRFTHAHTVA